jgi:PAS domain S-box-containing protein
MATGTHDLPNWSSRFQLLLETSLDGFWLVGPDARLLDVNDAYCRMSGYTREELLDMRIFDLEAKEKPEETQAHIQKLLETGSDIFESRHRTKAGDIIEVEVSVTYWPKDHQLLCFIRNISERVRQFRNMEDLAKDLEHMVGLRTEELRTALEAARAADHAKAAFLARMSHELYTPLNAILGFSQLLEMDSPNPLDAHQKSYVHEISVAGRHLLRLIEEILEYSLNDPLNREPQPQPVDCIPLISECIRLLEPSARMHSISIHDYHVMDIKVLGDEQFLKRILLGLLSNAVQYNQEGGQVWISCGIVEDRKGRLSVRDNGRGIPAECLDKIFEPFMRVESSAKGTDGIGMGLTLCKQMVQRMGGSIGVASTLGLGSEFWVDLPLADGQIRQGEG